MSTGSLDIRRQTYQYYTLYAETNLLTGYQMVAELPTDFSLDYHGDQILCNSDSIEETDSEACSYLSNRLSFYAIDSTWSSQYPIELEFYNVENPAAEGNVSYTKFSYVNLDSGLVTIRSFNNLNRPDPFKYEIQGKLLVINDNEEVEVMKGTRTNPIMINFYEAADYV